MKSTTAALLIILTQIAIVLVLTSDNDITNKFFASLELIILSAVITLYIDNNPNKIK